MDRFFYNIRIFLTAFVQRPIEWILQYVLGIQDSRAQSIEAQNVCRVQIKAPNRTIPLVLQSSWSIIDVKNQVAAILDVEPETLGIILAGRELDDKVEISSCDLGMNTIIHAVHIVHKKPKQPLNEELVDLQITGEERKKEVVKAHFFVYCKDCKPNYLQTGRLRTRCYACKETSILIHRDPCGWSDVLDQPGTIKGHCLNSLCGTTAEQAAPVEFFFKCHAPDHPNSDANEVPPLYQIRTNLHDVPCLACGDSLETVMVFENCLHVCCLSCFEVYICSRLNERQLVVDDVSGYTLGCPVGCESSLIREPKHFCAFLSEEDYDRYQRFASEEFVLKSGGVICPMPDCGTGILLDDPEERKIKCQNCNFVFCKQCLNGFHIGECEEPLESRWGFSTLDNDNVSRARWQDQKSSILTIKVMTKPCPKCRTPTERDGGCMHMECTRCNFQWCWLCQTTMIVVLRNLVIKCSRPCCEVRMISSTKIINQKKKSTLNNVTSNRNKSLIDQLRTRHGRRTIARKLEGLPSESEAPHLKCVFASDYDSYALLSPLTNWCLLPLLAVTNYGMYVLNQPIVIFANVFMPIWVYGTYYCARTMPLRMYYDEKEDKTFATFAHPFIPFKFTRKEIRHNSLVAKGRAFGGGIMYHNSDNLKIAFASEDFRLPIDLKRLLKT